MKFNFIPLGGGQEIGANSYLIQINDKNIILDAGSNPNYRGFRALPKFELLPKKIDAIFVSHAHFDHIGSLPIYASLYKDVDVYMTEPTFKLSKRMLHNTINNMLEQKKEKVDLDDYQFLQFYNHGLLNYMYSNFNFHKIKYDRFVTMKNSDIQFKFIDASHIVGSAGVLFETKGFKFFYTGDYKLTAQSIEKGATFEKYVKDIDILITESTYATKKSNHYQEESSLLLNYILENVRKNKKILLPSFAVGRTQELIEILGKGQNLFPELKKIPIFVLGLGNSVTDIYKIYTDLSDLKNFNKNEMKTLIQKNGAQIIIATNGMLMRNTASFDIAREFVQRKDSCIIFSGYVSPKMPGFKLLQFSALSKLFKLPSQKIKISKEAIKQFHLSAHADDTELNGFIKSSGATNIILVHGDKKKIGLFKKNKSNLNKNVFAPVNGELIYYDNREKLLVSAREQQAIIVTVGISLLSNFRRISKKKIDYKTIVPLLKFIEETGIKSSAEIESIEKLRQKQVNITEGKFYLLVSDTKDGRFVGKVLKLYFRTLNYNVEIIKIKGLVPQAKEFAKIGLVNFINSVADIIEKHSGNAIINATGGYKAEISYATVLGILYKLKVYYLFDNFEEIIDLPQLPLNFDFNYFKKYYENMEMVLNTASFEYAKDCYEKLPEILKPLFFVNENLGKFYLTPNGVAFMRAYKNDREMMKNNGGNTIFDFFKMSH